MRRQLVNNETIIDWSIIKLGVRRELLASTRKFKAKFVQELLHVNYSILTHNKISK
jgi:hypothetical protein